jgi:hypothetical protein
MLHGLLAMHPLVISLLLPLLQYSVVAPLYASYWLQPQLLQPQRRLRC